MTADTSSFGPRPTNSTPPYRICLTGEAGDDWLLTGCRVRTADGDEWSFVQPCLTTEEADGLAVWLGQVAAGDSHHANEWAANLYRKARDRGHDHPHAVRILGRAWINVIWKCWTTNTRYDPERHGALQRLQSNERAEPD